ncbi:MAG: TPM domain-containing protein [Elusimicrobia bacterium]|nr:TPM domain-containing protein [Elusimicrobiota bacterium]
MKNKSIALLALFLPATLFSLSPRGFVNDYAEIMSPQAKAAAEAVCGQLEKLTNAELAVLTVKNLNGKSIEEFAVDIFEKWGIGKKEKDNGVLLLVAPSERKVRIEVGYGLEGVLNDAKAGDIIRNYIIPYFKKGDYSTGIVAGATIIAQDVSAGLGVKWSDPENVRIQRQKKRKSPFEILLSLLFLFFIFGRFWLFPLFFIGGGSGGFGGFSGGGFGGFGGFGGGISGGGGASGSW